ncbi:hypothetical protein KY285_006834 [Solanum tuberosum]|nr:hypothetical protein KY285_006834 [Solanum tuberosum]
MNPFHIRLVDPLDSSGLIPLAGFRYPGSASCTSLIQLSTPESVDVAGSVPTSISISAELRKPGQGFAWGQKWSPGAGPAQGVGSGRDRYAFKEQVSDKCFKELTLEVVSHAKGLPLALKVFGCFFHKRDITEWRSAIKQIKNNPSSEIVEKLKISYDGLETIQQSIFLDIACFLRGRRKDYVMQILESCDIGAVIGLSVLIDKSLVSISGKFTIEMHDLIQDMGKYVVKKQRDPGERSRLWLTKDFEEVMINNTGTKAVEAIWVPNFNRPRFSKEAMTIMQRLRILCIHDSNCLDGSIEYLPNNLRWFVWNNYPCESLPENFEPQKLVHLDLSLSSLQHLWTGKKHLPFLQKLDLRDSRSLMQTPDFTWMPNLKYLDLSYCRNLSEVHHSLGYSRELIELNLYNCGRLKRFPCVNVESLDYMDLEFCSSLEKFPIIFGTMKPELKIKTGLSGIKELPSSVTYQTHIINKFGFRRYKDEPELESLLQMRENNDEPTEHCIGTKRSRYDNSEPRDEASCSSSKKQWSLSDIRRGVASFFRNIADIRYFA